MTTLAFDVYGTLIDTAGVTTVLEKHLGDAHAAAEFSNTVVTPAVSMSVP